jgi:hypothetical protein
VTVDSYWKGVYETSGFSLLAGGLILVIFLLLVFILQVQLPLTTLAAIENPMPPAILFSLALPADARSVGTLYVSKRCQAGLQI